MKKIRGAILCISLLLLLTFLTGCTTDSPEQTEETNKENYPITDLTQLQLTLQLTWELQM